MRYLPEETNLYELFIQALVKTYLMAPILGTVRLVQGREVKIMTINAGSERTNVNPMRQKSRLRQTLLSPMLCSVVASIGIFGGISALFIGLVCVVLHVMFAGDTAFDTVGTVLLIVAIPMILVGSIFLDEIGEKRN